MSVDPTLPVLINDQGTFLNNCSNTISQTPLVELAFLSNVSQDSDGTEFVINLNPVCLVWCDFQNLFFTSNSGAFWINPAAANSCAISINRQTYESTQKKCIIFNLVEQVKKAWSVKNSKLEGSIPPQVNLLLNKYSIYNNNLSTANYAVGLSLDQVISQLLANNQIVPADSSNYATVQFTVTYRYYFKLLDVTLLVNFNYITKIPCFKNNQNCDFCPYSNANQNCRPCFNVPDDNTIGSFLDGNLNQFEEYSVDLNNAARTVMTDNTSNYLANIIDSDTVNKSGVGASTVISDSSGSVW